jgi:stage V sporulation protein G
MHITDVKVFPVREEKLRAFVSIILDDCFMINDIKIIQGKDTLFISMPSRRKKNGDFKDVAHPLNNDTRRWIEERVLSEYRQTLEGPAGKPTAAALAPLVPVELALATPLDGPPAILPPVTPTNPATLKEVEDLHLQDSFWNV